MSSTLCFFGLRVASGHPIVGRVVGDFIGNPTSPTNIGKKPKSPGVKSSYFSGQLISQALLCVDQASGKAISLSLHARPTKAMILTLISRALLSSSPTYYMFQDSSVETIIQMYSFPSYATQRHLMLERRNGIKKSPHSKQKKANTCSTG